MKKLETNLTKNSHYSRMKNAARSNGNLADSTWKKWERNKNYSSIILGTRRCADLAFLHFLKKGGGGMLTSFFNRNIERISTCQKYLILRV